MASELKQQLTRWAAVAVLLGVGVAAFGTIFAPPGYLLAGGIGLAAGLAIAAIAMPRFITPIVVLVAVLVLGPLATHRNDRPDSLIPTFGNVREFVVLSATAFKRILTINLPEVTAQFGMLAVPYLTTFAAALAAGFALRRHQPALAFLAASAPLLVAILVGTARTHNAALLGVVFGAAAIVLIVVQRFREGHGFLWRAARVVAAMVVLAVAAGAGLVAAPLLTGENREVLRDYLPQDLKPYEYATPLAKFRYYRTDLRDAVLMNVEGIPAGERIRVATMDYYDGSEYHVAGSDDPTRISGVFGNFASARAGSEAATANLPQGNFVDAHIDIDRYADVWFPGPARINWLTCSGPRMQDLLDGLYFNQATGTAMTTVGLRKGDSYTVGGTLAVVPTEQQLADAVFAQVVLPADDVPDLVGDYARNIVSLAPRPIDKVLALQGFLQQGGFYNGGATVMPVGHDAQRILDFLTAQQIVGDDEQYAVAMALMAKSVGIPARVVAGFQVAPDRTTITGDDARAWVEIAFDGLGWVQFDPAPPRDKVPPAPPTPAAPPGTPDEPDEPEEQQPEEEKPPVQQAIDDLKESLPSALLPLWNVGLLLLKALGILLMPLLIAIVVVAIKARRRRRRRAIADPSHRVSAGWHEVADTAVDLGVARSVGATRLETANRARVVLPAAGMVSLARLADADSFAPGVPDEVVADEYWAAVERWRAEVRSATPKLKWWRQAVSVRSLRASSHARSSWSLPKLPWTSRLGAFFADWFLVSFLFGMPVFAAMVMDETGWGYAVWLAVGLVFVPLNIMLTAETGQSVGKQLFNVRTEMMNSNRHSHTEISVAVVLSRVVLLGLFNNLLLAGAWSVLLRADRRGWHDLLTGTRVVSVEEREEQ